MEDSHPVWGFIVDALGVAYFLAWSVSFYPQVLLNYRRKRTDGLSPDFVYLNPLGFICLSIWNGGMIYSSLARSQYAARHDGHVPQVAMSDLAFSVHAAAISLITLGQVWYYRRHTNTTFNDVTAPGEREPLVRTSVEASKAQHGGTTSDPAIPSTPCQFALAGIFISAASSAFFVANGKLEWLDWLYFISSIKLFVSAVKYAPQIILNWRLGAVEGLAIGQIILVCPRSLHRPFQMPPPCGAGGADKCSGYHRCCSLLCSTGHLIHLHRPRSHRHHC